MLSAYVTMIYVFAFISTITSVRSVLILDGKLEPKFGFDFDLIERYEPVRKKKVGLGFNPKPLRWCASPITVLIDSVLWPASIFGWIIKIFKK